MSRLSVSLRVQPNAIVRWVLAALWQQRLRSLLALSGVALGVAGCLIALALGEGSKRGIVAQLEGMGLANVYLRARPQPVGAPASAAKPIALTWAHASALQAGLQTARIVPIARAGSAPVLLGVTDQLPAVLDIAAEEGRLIGNIEQQDAQLACVIPSEWAAAADLRLGSVVDTVSGACVVIGILRLGDVGTLRLALALPEESMQLALVALPRVADAQRLPLAEARLSDLIVGLHSSTEAEAAPAWLNRSLGALALENSVDLVAPAAQVRRAIEARSLLDRLQLAFGLALLLVAGFGVMNLMLATVGERQSEIGLRRAVGASYGAILCQFLLEAVAICVLGGTVGVVLGLIGLAFAVLVLAMPVSVSYTVVILPLLSATAAGLVFGVFPAWRAARVEPLSALQGVS